eukprot:Nk52_evm89s2192 gene=Nk52_evmTU89s2192
MSLGKKDSESIWNSNIPEGMGNLAETTGNCSFSIKKEPTWESLGFPAESAARGEVTMSGHALTGGTAASSAYSTFDKDEILASMFGTGSSTSSLSLNGPDVTGLISAEFSNPAKLTSGLTQSMNSLDLFLPGEEPSNNNLVHSVGDFGRVHSGELSEDSCMGGKDHRALDALYNRKQSIASVPNNSVQQGVESSALGRSDSSMNAGMNSLTLVPQIPAYDKGSTNDLREESNEDPGEVARREAKLERNRQCAREARQKKKQYIESLEQELEEATTLNAALQKKYKSLESTNQSLLEELSSAKSHSKHHKDRQFKPKRRKNSE